MGSGHDGQSYVLTGPGPVSPRDQAAALGETLGEPVRFAGLTEDEARVAMLAFMPPVIVDATLAILGSPTADERLVHPGVERVLAVLAGPSASGRHGTRPRSPEVRVGCSAGAVLKLRSN
ncbi:hypothetical protein [Amycolatopsis sp. NPDC051071]|uniref:hypothetical protein n=1 Tax=Amycolatopsis sp. NPDC051071 TaxID=3154637 RepID=UPI00342BA8DB